MVILEGNSTEKDEVELKRRFSIFNYNFNRNLKADGTVEDAALGTKESNCKEEKGTWHSENMIRL